MTLSDYVISIQLKYAQFNPKGMVSVFTPFRGDVLYTVYANASETKNLFSLAFVFVSVKTKHDSAMQIFSIKH